MTREAAQHRTVAVFVGLFSSVNNVRPEEEEQSDPEQQQRGGGVQESSGQTES